MHPHSFKEELSSGFYCDILLVGCQNGDFREFFNDHENIVIDMLIRRKVGDVIHGYGFPRLTRSRKRGI